MSSETEEVSVAPAVDPAVAAAAADLIIDESCAAAAAAAVTASFNAAAAQGNHTQKDTEISQNPDAAVNDVSEKVNDIKISPVNGTIDNNVEGNSEACAADEVKQRRSVSGSPLPASTSGSLVPATGQHLLQIIVLFSYLSFDDILYNCI